MPLGSREVLSGWRVFPRPRGLAYVFTRDGDGFLDVQQELLLRIMEAVDAAGTVIAIPSQTLHIADGRLPDNPATDPR